jgi:hypothetical protein
VTNRQRHRNPHTTAKHISAVDIQMVKQSSGLLDVGFPGQRLQTTAGSTGLPAIVGNDLKLIDQSVERQQLFPSTARRPAHDGRIKTAGGQHQERRTAAGNLVVRLDSVKGCVGHDEFLKETSSLIECV